MRENSAVIGERPQQMNQKQNFEYKDEIQFKGENVEQRHQRYLDNDVTNSANVDITNDISKIQLIDPALDFASNIDSRYKSNEPSSQNPKNASSSFMGNLMKKISFIKEAETDQLESRNVQSKMKSGVGKVIGVSMLTNVKDDIDEKTREQALSRKVNSIISPLNMKRDAENSDPDSVLDSERTTKKQSGESGVEDAIKSSEENVKKVY